MGGPPEPAVDAELSAALATLVIPEHHPGFWPRLGERLIAERDSPAPADLDPKARVDQVDRRADAVTVERRGAGSPWRPRRHPPVSPQHPAVAQLAERANWVREPRRRRPGLVGVAVFAAAAVAATTIWVVRNAEDDSSTASARAIATRLSRNLAAVASLSGTVEVTRPSGVERFAFTRTANGSFRVRGLDVFADTGYDASALSARTWRIASGPAGLVTATGSEATGLAAGPPDLDGRFPYLRDDDLSRVVQVLLTARTAEVRETTAAGRPALTIEADQVPTMRDPADHLEVVLDRADLLPIRLERTAAGTSLEVRRFTDLRTTATVPPDAFSVSFPGTVLPSSSYGGFSPVPLPQVQLLVGYAPVTPSWLPPGFELSAVAVLTQPPFGQQSTGDGANPPNTGVVSVAYRRGVELVTITIRRTDAAARWVDPFGTGGPTDRRSPIRLRGGRFLGTIAEQASGPTTLPHLWGRTPDLVFTVAGDVQPDEVVRIAESLG